MGNSAVCKNLQRDSTVLIVNAILWNIYFSTISLVAQIADAQSWYTVELKLSFRAVLDGWLLKNLEDQMTSNCMLKVNCRGTKSRCKTWPKRAIKTL